MALVRPAHGERGVHVHVVACKIKTDQALEQDSPSRPGRAEKYQQTSGCATVSYHVEHRAKGSGLVIDTGCIAVKAVQEA